jgi:hypothetical protein
MNHEGCPKHRSGTVDLIFILERKVQGFVLRVCRVDADADASGAQNVTETDIHLYVLQGDSALLSHLQSSWWARLMVSPMHACLAETNACAAVVKYECSSPPTQNPTIKTHPVGVQFATLY